MSKLPNAPLVEVILELRWTIKDQAGLTKYKYLAGDIYNKLNKSYPYRENIHPPEIPLEILINKPEHRYREAEKEYPLIQVGPGVITLNTIDEKYFWKDFSLRAKEYFETFLTVYPESDKESFKPVIIYVDFFPFDFNKTNVNQYINENFGLEFKQKFLTSTLTG